MDLSHLVLFAGEGTPTAGVRCPEYRGSPAALSEWGWNISSYRAFEYWEEELRQPQCPEREEAK